MKERVFTTEFYQKMYNDIIRQVTVSDRHIEDLEKGRFIGMDYEAEDGTYLTFEAQFETEVNGHVSVFDPSDESYTLDVIDIIDLTNVKAYENGLRDSEELTGFDTDAFFNATENI